MKRELVVALPQQAVWSEDNSYSVVTWHPHTVSCELVRECRVDAGLVLLVHTPDPITVHHGPPPFGQHSWLLLLESKERNVVWPAGGTEIEAIEKFNLVASHTDLFPNYARYSKPWGWLSPDEVKMSSTK